MRTTITLEADVAARLRRLRGNQPFKELVNKALRAGLDQLEGSVAERPARYEVRPVEGHPRRNDLDNVAEVIAEAEGDDFR